MNKIEYHLRETSQHMWVVELIETKVKWLGLFKTIYTRYLWYHRYEFSNDLDYFWTYSIPTSTKFTTRTDADNALTDISTFNTLKPSTYE